MNKPRKATVLQFKISLLDITPEIWRRIQIPEVRTFDALHYAVQDAFQWLNCHLHQFHVERYKVISDVRFELDGYGDLEVVDEEFFKLKEFFHEPGDSIVYEYDFGDSWLHNIVLESRVFRENGKRYPCCIDGQCAAPPEDVGSTPGFERFLEIIADPKHGEYDDMMNWYLDTTAPYRDSKPYDPDRFDLAETNRWLKNQKTRKDTEANTELC